MLRPRCIAETEDDVLQACGLRCRPMNTVDADIRSSTSCIENQVPDLPVENIGIIESQTSSRQVLITVNERESREVRSGFDSR